MVHSKEVVKTFVSGTSTITVPEVDGLGSLAV